MSTDEFRSTSPFASDPTDYHGAPLDSDEARFAWIVFGSMTIGLVWAYWNMLARVAAFWNDDLYSHGYIVPVFAAYLFWVLSGHRIKLKNGELAVGYAYVGICAVAHFLNTFSGVSLPDLFYKLEVSFAIGFLAYCMREHPLTHIEAKERWIGLGIIAASLALRLVGSYYDMAPYDRLSFVGALVGVCQMVGGWNMLRWAGLPMVFLLFMFPLPQKLEVNLLGNLQRLAAMCSNWTLQTMGISSIRDGNRIIIDGLANPLHVADGCSGLRMLTIFCSLAVAMAMLIRRPWWDRFVILLSAIPIAVVANIIRITLISLLYMLFGQDTQWLDKIIHDWAGFAMMPIGLGILWVEMQILSRITVPIEEDDYAALGTAAG